MLLRSAGGSSSSSSTCLRHACDTKEVAACFLTCWQKSTSHQLTRRIQVRSAVGRMFHSPAYVSVY
jgi:hypothetical protein